MRYFLMFLVLILTSASVSAKNNGARGPRFVPITSNEICILVEGNFTQCYQTAGTNDPVNVVYECPLAGDATVPLHINTGVSNPGPGVVAFITKNPGEFPFLVDIQTFEARFAQVLSGGFFRTIYLNDPAGPAFPDVDVKEPLCVCHATDANAAQGCPDFLPFVDPPIP